jgi:hypothetical protein
MFKGLIFLLCIISTSVFGYTAIVEQVGNDLVLSIEGKRIVFIDRYGIKSKETQEKILDSVLKQVDFCTTKGQWGKSLADEAKDKIGNVNSHIKFLHEMTEGYDIPHYMIVDTERMIREAYRSGHKDPHQFGIQVIKECLVNGF